MLLDLPIAVQYTKRDPEFNAKLKFVGKPLAPGFYVIAFRKDQEELAARVRRGHRPALPTAAAEDGSTSKWDLWNDDQQALATGKIAATTARVGRPLDVPPVLSPCCWAAP